MGFIRGTFLLRFTFSWETWNANWLPVTLQALTVSKSLMPETHRGMCEYMHVCTCNQEGKTCLYLKTLQVACNSVVLTLPTIPSIFSVQLANSLYIWLIRLWVLCWEKRKIWSFILFKYWPTPSSVWLWCVRFFTKYNHLSFKYFPF